MPDLSLRSSERAPKTFRLFLSFNPEPPLIEKLAQAQSRLRSHLEFHVPALCHHIAWVRAAQMHLTLLFFGDVPSESAPGIEESLRSCVSDLPRPKLALGKLGSFPMFRQPKVLWLGVQKDRTFEKLQQRVMDRFQKPFRLDPAPSFPHITLARVKLPSSAKSKGPPDFSLSNTLESFAREIESERFEWEPEAVSLMRSDSTTEGRAYHCLGTVKLDG